MNTKKAQLRPLIMAAVAALGLLALTLADRWIWAHLKVEHPEDLPRKDWYAALRQVGYWPTWVVVGVLIMLADLRPSVRPVRLVPISRGMLVVVSSGLGGLMAELVKVLAHRYRPGESGEYMFSWAMDGDRGPGFGLASSHAGVAFGAAFMLARLFPATAPAAIALAVGCGVTRLLAGAHFATDVYLAAVMSYAVAAGLWRVSGRLMDARGAAETS